MERKERLTVREAAEIMEMSPDRLRKMMIQKELPIGYVSNCEHNREFYIYQDLVHNAIHGKNISNVIFKNILIGLRDILSDAINELEACPQI